MKTVCIPGHLNTIKVYLTKLESPVMKTLCVQILSIAFFLTIYSCTKSPVTVQKNQFGYGDSVFYLRTNDYTISPVNATSGTYTAFPDNLLIDNATGAITIALKGKDGQSQTGLKYMISFRSSSGDFVDSTSIIIAGINYLDGCHYLPQNDSLVSPTYNADAYLLLPPG